MEVRLLERGRRRCRDRARWQAPRPLRPGGRAHDGFRQHVGRERADDAGVRLTAPHRRGEWKTVSPSPIVCDGLIARAIRRRPSAPRDDVGLGQTRIGCNDAIVVFSAARGATAFTRLPSRRSFRASRVISRRASAARDNLPGRGIDDINHRIDGHQAATVKPSAA